MWLDVAMIVFAVTAANHMGLIDAAEKTVGFKLPIVNCCKCGSFWTTLVYGIICHAVLGPIPVIAISFLAAFCAVWLELLMGYIDTLYDKCYERIYTTSDSSETDGNKSRSTTGNEDHTTAALP